MIKEEINMKGHDIMNKNIEYYEKNDVYDWFQKKQIRIGFENGLTQEQIDRYAILDTDYEPIYDWKQMIEIRKGFENGLSEEQIDYYAALNDEGNPIENQAEIQIILNCVGTGR